MAQNITIQGASYPDVPSVTLPKTGGGTAWFTDVTPTTAVESDVASGKVFFKADGSQATGTATSQGVSVVTTQDSHGGDIVTITAQTITPWSPYGNGAELITTYDMGTIKLSATGFNGWSPSATATSIKATTNLGTITSPSLDQYEYVLHTVFESNTQYASGTTLNAAVVRQIFDIVQTVYRKPSTRTNLASSTDNYNYCTTLFTAPFMEYYNTTPAITMAWTGSYGIYCAATAATFSSSTSTSATITVRSPVFYARCNDSYFTTTMASAVDQANSSIKCKVEVYRVSKGGSPMYNMFHNIVSAYNA